MEDGRADSACLVKTVPSTTVAVPTWICLSRMRELRHLRKRIYYGLQRSNRLLNDGNKRELFPSQIFTSIPLLNPNSFPPKTFDLSTMLRVFLASSRNPVLTALPFGPAKFQCKYSLCCEEQYHHHPAICKFEDKRRKTGGASVQRRTLLTKA